MASPNVALGPLAKWATARLRDPSPILVFAIRVADRKDQVRTVDKARLVKRLSAATGKTLLTTLRTLQEMFAA